MQNSIGKADYDAMVARIGQNEADRRMREYGWKILPAEDDFSAIPVSEASNLLVQGGLSKAAGGGEEMEDEDQSVANDDAAENAAADAGAVDAYASLGGLNAMDLTDPKQISKAILANAAQQKQYYDKLAAEIKQRRYGPSESEKLLALSSAFFSPTSVRGFSGTMGNVLPVLQKFGELRRTGEQERTEALQNLAKQRMALAQGDIKTAIDLQRLLATYNKPKPKGTPARATVGTDQRIRHSVYATEIIPPSRDDLYKFQSFMRDPNVTDDQREQAKANFDKAYGVGAAEIYGGEE